MTAGLSTTSLSNRRAACEKPVIRFDMLPVEPPARSGLADDVRFFVTAWACGFVIFYSFIF